MIWGIVTAGAALLLILVALLHAQRRRNRLEKEMVERARTTDLYRALYPVLRTANRCCVDRVLIRRDEVRIEMCIRDRRWADGNHRGGGESR